MRSKDRCRNSPARGRLLLTYGPTEGGTAMAGGTKPLPASKAKNTAQDGAHKGGGVDTPRHAGPKRASKTPPKRHQRLPVAASCAALKASRNGRCRWAGAAIKKPH